MNGHPTALHRTVLLVDVERFGDPARTNLHHTEVRSGMYGALKSALAQAGVPWDTCTTEDRGDGAMVLVPPGIPKSRLVDQFPARMVAALRVHNATRLTAARIRLRVALHAGEVHFDSHGVAGHAVNLAFRLLDAPALKAALADTPGVLALITSDWYYHEVVQHHPAAEPATYRQVAVAVKETKVPAWIFVPGTVSTEGSFERDAAGPLLRDETAGHAEHIPDKEQGITEQPPHPGNSPTDALFELVRVLLAVPSIAEDDTRRILVEQLRPDIAGAVPYHRRPRQHVIGIVRTCLNYDGGLADLVGVIEQIEGDSLPVRDLKRTMAKLRPWLTE